MRNDDALQTHERSLSCSSVFLAAAAIALARGAAGVVATTYAPTATDSPNATTELLYIGIGVGTAVLGLVILLVICIFYVPCTSDRGSGSGSDGGCGDRWVRGWVRLLLKHSSAGDRVCAVPRLSASGPSDSFCQSPDPQTRGGL